MDLMCKTKNKKVFAFPEFGLENWLPWNPAAMKLIEAVVTWRWGCSQEC